MGREVEKRRDGEEKVLTVPAGYHRWPPERSGGEVGKRGVGVGREGSRVKSSRPAVACFGLGRTL